MNTPSEQCDATLNPQTNENQAVLDSIDTGSGRGTRRESLWPPGGVRRVQAIITLRPADLPP